MEAVKLFNQELSSLYELKPPISKAKMTSITKGAIKAIKFYKHVVQSVEKFIQKCRPEYKIPGLYVIDSIVRQSRHQFGAEKDVFAPRFAKNVQYTFFHLYKCTEEEKSKVIRVLNLWQKNEVFPSEVIQPLFDMANPKSDIFRQMDEQVKSGGGKPPQGILQLTPSKSTIQVSSEFRSLEPAASMHQSPGGNNVADQQTTQQLQTILHLLKNHAQPSHEQVKFNKKLLDFDYSDDEDAAETSEQQQQQQPSPAMLEALQGILGNPVVLQKLKNMGAISDHQIQQLQQLLPAAQQQSHNQQHFQQPPPQMMQQGMVPGGFPQGVPAPQGMDPAVAMQYQQFQDYGQQQAQRAVMTQHVFNSPAMGWAGGPAHGNFTNLKLPGQSPLEEGERAETDEDIQIVEDRTVNSGGWNKRVAAGGRRRSRSRSRDRKRGRRSRSRSRDRSRGGRRGEGEEGRSRDRGGRQTEEDREREKVRKKEREKKGLPPIREGYLSVCSTTLWVGHLSKLVAEEDLSDLFGEFGEVNIISLIAPRGCAFVCMNRRMDASKALKALHKHKLQGKPITLAWAPGKGMKDKQWKDFWDVELGVSYIPIDKLDPQVDMVALEDGGMFDEDTMPDWMKTMRGVAPNSSHIPPAGSAQFIPVPDGIPPSRNPLMQGHLGLQDPTQIPIPVAGPPPGLPPFGLPPGAPPPVGLLVPGTGPGLLSPPPGAPGLVGAAPPSLLLGPPLGPHQFPVVGAPLLSGPPPGFAFDASQPPPGLRLPPFLPPRMPSAVEVMENNNGNQHDDMDLDHDIHHASDDRRGPQQQRVLGGGGRRVEPRPRESRWNNDKSDVGSSSENSLANRLRNLAGHGTDDGPAGARGGSTWQQNGGPPPPFGDIMDRNEDRLGEGPIASFRRVGAPFDENPMRFGPPGRGGGPMPNGEDQFPPDMGPPPQFGGPDRRPFDESPFPGGGPDSGFGGPFNDGPVFRGGAGPPPFGALPPFGGGGNEFGGRGGRGRGRGRIGLLRGGFRGRGDGFRDGPQGGGGMWMDDGPIRTFNPFDPINEISPREPGGLGGPSPWERGAGRGTGRGFGDRGGFPPGLPHGQMELSDERAGSDRRERDERPQKRERKSRWGGDDEQLEQAGMQVDEDEPNASQGVVDSGESAKCEEAAQESNKEDPPADEQLASPVDENVIEKHPDHTVDDTSTIEEIPGKEEEDYANRNYKDIDTEDAVVDEAAHVTTVVNEDYTPVAGEGDASSAEVEQRIIIESQPSMSLYDDLPEEMARSDEHTQNVNFDLRVSSDDVAQPTPASFYEKKQEEEEETCQLTNSDTPSVKADNVHLQEECPAAESNLEDGGDCEDAAETAGSPTEHSVEEEEATSE